METEIREYLKQSSGWIVLRGAVAVLFGVLALARPGITVAALVLMCGGYAVADGVVALVTGVRQRGRGHPLWPWLLAGILGIVTGVLTFLAPGIIATYAIAFGFFLMVLGRKGWREARREHATCARASAHYLPAVAPPSAYVEA